MKVMYFSALLFALLLPLSGHAQLAGHNTKGDFGLLAGTQAPPGFYVIPLLYDFTADTLRDQNMELGGKKGYTVRHQRGIYKTIKNTGLMWLF